MNVEKIIANRKLKDRFIDIKDSDGNIALSVKYPTTVIDVDTGTILTLPLIQEYDEAITDLETIKIVCKELSKRATLFRLPRNAESLYKVLNVTGYVFDLYKKRYDHDFNYF